MGLPSGCMSDYLEAKLIDHIFRTNSYTKPSIAIGLTSNIGTDSSFSEVASVGAYARQSLNPSDANWSHDDLTINAVYNNAAITFPVATADWGYASGVIICDSATNGAGNALFYGSLAVPQLIQNTNQMVIPISGIQVRLD